MNKYTMTCSCGHTMEKETATRADAVAALKADMTEEVIATHMADKHPGEPVPSKTEIDETIEKMTEPQT